MKSTFVDRVVLACALFIPLATVAQEGPYPSRPIRLILANAPGSSIDTMARILTVRMGETLGQPLVVENRDGAAGAIGMEAGKNARPDGYTLVCASSSAMTVLPAIRKNIPYDPVNDFAYIGNFAIFPNVLVVNPQMPVRNVKELVEFARANKGKVNMASAGVGSTSHLAGVILTQMGGFEALHVPHKGGGPSVASVVAGETHFTFAPAPAAMSQVKAGRLRAIGHSLPSRSAMLGDMPAVNETLPGYDYSTWAGMLAPKGTPQPLLDRVLAALEKTTELPAVREGFAAQGAEISVIRGEAYRKYVAQDLVNTAKFVQAAGLKAE
jgi:tripartite-type tricarboxylate transporter receptor subunit TctC